ncbi:heterogeneous nuclear ribonucleoprotein U-like protein 2 [Polyodon spathula]|uniref:heterogeneous nuclear ribonucleoprotein U-like protein 2 n=1 Tax=Polyodon spathula TaxID=7913 RepID=UPI001B7E40C9|nr:heterogeneous nuclear ribonucleoprotein U-like protein 2 [Polyodon spathula]
MMVGMPGAGKSHWARTHMAENPDKRYNVLGTSNILARMRDLQSQPQSEGLQCDQKELFLQHATQCLSQLIQIAARKRRNYILDQANVYSSAQRRKLLRFQGFCRRAVVVCPSDEEWKRRLGEQQREEGEEVAETSLLKVKVSFTLPSPCEFLEEVLYSDLLKEEVETLSLSALSLCLSAVSFTLPSPCEFLEEVLYSDLPKEEVETLSLSQPCLSVSLQ